MTRRELSIIKTPYQFATQWYDVDGIHRAITRSAQKKSLGDLPDVPENVYSRHFAEWLAGQYRLAMIKGAELAKDELNASQLLAACKLQLANIEHWLETGEPATPEQSQEIYKALKAAVQAAKGEA